MCATVGSVTVLSVLSKSVKTVSKRVKTPKESARKTTKTPKTTKTRVLALFVIYPRILLVFFRVFTCFRVFLRVFRGWSKVTFFRPWVRYMKHVCFGSQKPTTFSTRKRHFLTLFGVFVTFSGVLPFRTEPADLLGIPVSINGRKTPLLVTHRKHEKHEK